MTKRKRRSLVHFTQLVIDENDFNALHDMVSEYKRGREEYRNHMTIAHAMSQFVKPNPKDSERRVRDLFLHPGIYEYDDPPECICNLSALESLTLQQLRIRSVPENFGRLQSLTTLCLRDLPSVSNIDSVTALPNLNDLTIDCLPALLMLPDRMPDLTHLKG